MALIVYTDKQKRNRIQASGSLGRPIYDLDFVIVKIPLFAKSKEDIVFSPTLRFLF